MPVRTKDLIQYLTRDVIGIQTIDGAIGQAQIGLNGIGARDQQYFLFRQRWIDWQPDVFDRSAFPRGESLFQLAGGVRGADIADDSCPFA